VRRLAADLRINPNTVARAYQDLERDGLIRTVPGGGCFVSGNGVGLLKTEKVKRLRPLATQVAVEGRQLRLLAEEILDLVKEELEKLK
jgi:GntR family transcriptional regulator